METRKRKVAVIGALNVDIGGTPEAAFMPGDSIPGRITVSLGGVGFNIARCCAAMGADAVFFSVLGEDGQAPAIRAEAARFGLSLAGCRWEQAENNRYLYIGGKGGDMAAAVNDMRLCARMDEAFIRELLPALADFDAVACDTNLPPEALRLLITGSPAPVITDCVSAVKCGRLRESLGGIHTLKANRMEAETLTGRIEPEDCARTLLGAGVRRAAISLGAEGVLCAEGERSIRVPAESVPIVDTTGAGDSLTAALAVGLAGGLPLAHCAALGMRAAAITMGQRGAVTEKLSELKEAFL